VISYHDLPHNLLSTGHDYNVACGFTNINSQRWQRPASYSTVTAHTAARTNERRIQSLDPVDCRGRPPQAHGIILHCVSQWYAESSIMRSAVMPQFLRYTVVTVGLPRLRRDEIQFSIISRIFRPESM